MNRFIGILLILPILFWGGSRIIHDIQWDREVNGHLKRAADANSIELATKEMETVVSYLEKNGITHGYTSIFYQTPDEDVEFWYINLKSSLSELKATKADASPLERSNVLMKLRETLVDSGQSTRVTEPDGISIFPHNVAYTWWAITGLILALIGAITFLTYEPTHSRSR